MGQPLNLQKLVAHNETVRGIEKLKTMRTVLFIGLLSIADAIKPDWMNENHLWFYIIVFLGAVLSDIHETKKP